MFVFRRLQRMIRERRIPNRQRQGSSVHAVASENDDSTLEHVEAQTCGSSCRLRRRCDAARRRSRRNRTSNESTPPTMENIAERRIDGRIKDARQEQSLWNRVEPKILDGLLSPIDVVRGEVEEVRAEDLLPPDTFSFFATADYWTELPLRDYFHNLPCCPQCLSTLPCWNWRCCPRMSIAIAVFIFALQMATYSLVLVDVIDRSDPSNHLGVPAGVDTFVRVSQLFALYITVISQEEVILSLNVWYNGYDEDALRLARCKNPRQWKWRFSNFLRFLSGLFGLTVAFVLIMRSSEVRDLLLNFTAVYFVSSVDNAAFDLAKWNYICWGHVERDARTIVDARQSPGRRAKKWKACLRLPMLLLIGAGLLGGWVYISWKQSNGDYLSGTLYVQFSDEFSPTLCTFSGWYTLDKSRARPIFGRRLKYIESNRGNYSAELLARFEYCKKDRYWAFMYGDESMEHSRCSSSLAHSSQATTFNLAETASNAWFYRDLNTSSEFPLRHFSLRALDNLFGKHCDENRNCCDSRSNCGADSTFVCGENKQCVCRNGGYGPSNCLFSEPCRTIEVDSHSDGFRSTVALSTKYDILRNFSSDDLVTVYERPVYVSRHPRSKVKYDIILYTGRRWVLTDTDSLFLDTLKMGKFHAHWVDFNAKFISEPVDIGTPSDAVTPVDKKWFHAERLTAKVRSDGSYFCETQAPVLTRPANAGLLCAFCDDEENPCWYEGKCWPDGNCTCFHGSSGTLCRIPPVGNGQCDTFFNEAQFEYDGGDCCPLTCTSSTEHSCDLNVTKQFGLTTSTEYDWYRHCRDPDQLCDPSSADCFKPLVEIVGDQETEAQIGRSIAYSRNGRVVAFYDMSKNCARVFEQDGRHWVERGHSLTPPDEIDPRLKDLVFSNIPLSMVALSENGDAVATVWHRLSNVTSTREHAKSNPLEMNSDLVQVFEWQAEKNKWKQRGANILENSTVFSVSLSNTGDILAVGGVASASDGNATIGQLSMYWFVSPIKSARMEVFDTTNMSNASETNGTGLSLTMSGDASVVAVGYRANLDTKGVKLYKYDKISINGLKPLVYEPKSFDQVEFPETALSEDGSTLAVWTVSPQSALPEGRIYRRDHSSDSNWTQLGQRISCRTWAYHSGGGWHERLSLSSDGNMLAIGEPLYLGTGTYSGIVRIYRFDPKRDEWIKHCDDITGSPFDHLGDSVVLSGNGRMLAIGSPSSQYGRGSVSVLWNPPDPPPHNETLEPIPKILSSHVPITTEIQLGLIRVDTEVKLGAAGASLICNHSAIAEAKLGTFTVPFQKGQETFWVERGAPCEFHYYHWPYWNQRSIGHYKVYLGRSDTIATENLVAFVRDRGFKYNRSVWFNASDSLCEHGSIPLQVLVKTAYSPNRTHWEVANETTGEILLEDTYSGEKDSFRTTLNHTCVPDDECVNFTIKSKYGEGLCCNYGKGSYEVFLNGVEVAKGDDFGFERIHRIGNCIRKNCTGDATFRVEISTDFHGDAISWNAINNVTGKEVSRGGPYETGHDNVTHYFVNETCVSPDDCIKFNIYDSRGPGLPEGRGSYALFLDNELKAGGRRFNQSDERHVGNCSTSR